MSRLLGIGCGQLAGSAEILLDEALRAAAAEGAEVELVRLEELRIPSGPDAPSPTTRGGCGTGSSSATR